jgi:hypothetical protein
MSCIAGYALSQVIHRIQSKIIFHENTNLYIEWLGTIDCQYRAYLVDLRTPPPFQRTLRFSKNFPPKLGAFPKTWLFSKNVTLFQKFINIHKRYNNGGITLHGHNMRFMCPYLKLHFVRHHTAPYCLAWQVPQWSVFSLILLVVSVLQRCFPFLFVLFSV